MTEKEKLTPESCAALVRETPESFYSLPKKNRTAAICKLAIQGLGYPSVEAAVKDKPSLFRLLHPSLYDHDTCLAFVRSDYFKNAAGLVPGRGMQIRITGDDLEIDGEKIKLSKFLRFYDVCAEAVQASRLILEAVPRELITAELCELSIKADSFSFRYVPEEFKTKELCQLAFACDPWTLKSIPDRHKTPEMCLAAVKESGHLLKAVPDELKTREMCMIAVADGGRGLDAVPERLFDKEIALLAINNPETSAWRILGKIPERVRDYDVCLAAVTRSGDNLEFVPDEFISEEILLLVAATTPRCLQDFFPERFRTQDFIGRLIAQYPKTERFLKDKIPTAKPTPKKNPIFTITDGVLTKFDANGCLDITIPSDAKKVGRAVFWRSKIERIATAEGVIAFEERSFSECNSIKQFCISSTVRELPMASIRDELGAELQGLQEFVVDAGNEVFASCCGVLYNKEKTELIKCPQSFPESVFVVPDSVKQIREHAFYGCKNLREIVLPDHELDIGSFAFSKCRQLKSVNLPGNMESIPYGLFLNSGIETVVLPPALKELGGSVFRYSKLKEIKLPDGIQRIGGYAFNPCPLSEIRIPKSVVSPVEENTFSSAEIELETGLVPGGYLLFGTDTKALEKFTYARSKKNVPLADEDYFELIENKALLKKHYVFVAFLRAFIYDSDLSPDYREKYIAVVRNQKKRLLEYLASHDYEEYISKLLTSKIATKQEVAKIREQI